MRKIMAKMETGKGGYSINELSHGTEIIIPANKQYDTIRLLSVWLVGWGYGEVVGTNSLFSPDNSAPAILTIAWLGFWTFMGVVAIASLLWNINGKEIIRIDDNKLKHIRNYVLFSLSKEYEIMNIKKLETKQFNPSILDNRGIWESVGIPKGAIVFVYRYNNYKYGGCNFGSGLDEAGAKYLIGYLRSKYKNL